MYSIHTKDSRDLVSLIYTVQFNRLLYSNVCTNQIYIIQVISFPAIHHYIDNPHAITAWVEQFKLKVMETNYIYYRAK